VKAIVADFRSLFGRSLGRQVQELCIKWGWILMWGLGPGSGTGSEKLNQRVVDPAVLHRTSAHGSMDVSADDAKMFSKVWALANATAGAPGTKRPAETVGAWWAQLPDTVRVSVGVRAWQGCEDADRCVAVAVGEGGSGGGRGYVHGHGSEGQFDGSCVCYAKPAAAARDMAANDAEEQVERKEQKATTEKRGDEVVDAAPLPLASKKNVLYLVFDDLRPDLSFYGETHMSTPHLQKLADSGTVFERAYCQQTVCSPSRMSFTTGRRPNTTSTWNFLNQYVEGER
jgi:hypothetical protein